MQATTSNPWSGSSMKARLKAPFSSVVYHTSIRGSRTVTTFWQRTAQVKRDITAIMLSSIGWYPAAAGILVRADIVWKVYCRTRRTLQVGRVCSLLAWDFFWSDLR